MINTKFKKEDIQMGKVSPTKKKVAFIVIMVLLGSVVTLIGLILFGNSDQKYEDIIVGYPTIFSGNKTIECNILFGLIFLGIIIYGIFEIATKIKLKQQKNQKIFRLCFNNNQKSKEYIGAMAAMLIVYLIIYGNTYQIVLVSLLYALILFLIDSELIYTGVCTFYLGVYACIGLYRLYVYLGGVKYTNNMTLAMISLIIALLPLAFNNKKKALIKMAILESLVVPFGLLIYLTNKYKYGEMLVEIDGNNIIKCFILILITAMILESIYVLYKNWRQSEKIDNVITVGSCITIMAFNRFDGTGAIMPVDVHHPFENVIGYSQVFHLGQTLFKEYIPVSGMYSLLEGAIFEWFGNGGTFANYYITNNLYYLLLIVLLVFLIKAQLDGSYVLLISLIFYALSYNRLIFLLPIMLLLIWPKLIKNRNLWLVTWFLSSLFHGLYYPLYGVATCVAFLPLGIYQVIVFVKSGEFKRQIRRISFWVLWGVCFFLTFANLGNLLGTLKHMLAMSGQSILADGIMYYGQLIPAWFFTYLSNNHPAIRLVLYYLFVTMVPVTFVWVAFAVTVELADISFIKRKMKIGDWEKACVALSVVIMPIICYTYTFIRLDVGSIYARSTGVLFAGVVLLLVISWKYIVNEKFRIILTCFLVSIPAVVNSEGIFATESNYKLSAYYTVPEGYIYIEEDPVEKMGKGFISQARYDDIKKVHDKFSEKNRTQSYMGDPAWFGYYYLFDIKGDGVMEISSTIRSYLAAKEAIDIVRANKSILAPTFKPVENYYLYHWLLDSGEYYWDAAAWEFIPNEGLYTKEEIYEQNKNIGIVQNDVDIGKIAGSWGSSMSSLDGLFIEHKTRMLFQSIGNGITVNFDETFDGNDADFLYLEFADMEKEFEYTLYNLNEEIPQEAGRFGNYFMKKNYNPDMVVQIRWYDDNGEGHAMNCQMCKGKLLIPLGVGAKWLFNHHQSISIYVYKDGMEISVPTVSSLRMLKVREIE